MQSRVGQPFFEEKGHPLDVRLPASPQSSEAPGTISLPPLGQATVSWSLWAHRAKSPPGT